MATIVLLFLDFGFSKKNLVTINVNNSIFFWQDLAANGTNAVVAEAAKAHLDSYRYMCKRHSIT